MFRNLLILSLVLASSASFAAEKRDVTVAEENCLEYWLNKDAHLSEEQLDWNNKYRNGEISRNDWQLRRMKMSYQQDRIAQLIEHCD